MCVFLVALSLGCGGVADKSVEKAPAAADEEVASDPVPDPDPLPAEDETPDADSADDADETVTTKDPSPEPKVDPKPAPDPIPDPEPLPDPEPEPDPDPVPDPQISYAGNFSAIWAGEGGTKIPQEDTPASDDPVQAINSIWDGKKISLFGARNEVVNFQLLLEAATIAVSQVQVSLVSLEGPDGFLLKNVVATSGDQLYEWTNRQIELFYVRYLEIKGIGGFCCQLYDERHIPKRFQRPNVDGVASGKWEDRPDHNKHYPDIAVPLDLHPSFNVAVGNSQAIWVDLYIPKTAPSGSYSGTIKIKENGIETGQVPVRLAVRNFALPDEPSAKTMVFLGYPYLNSRYLGELYPFNPSVVAVSQTIINRHFLLAHRHKLSLIDANIDGDVGEEDAPRLRWQPVLDGSLFAASQGYDGPGVDVGNNIFSIGTYGDWGWKCVPVGDPDCEWQPRQWNESEMWEHADGWSTWFATHAPTTEYFLYLIDESGDLPQINTWASWINNNPGPGKNLKSMATGSAVDFYQEAPALDIPTSGMYVGETSAWNTAHAYFKGDAGKRFYMYNSGRPAAGSFMIEDDGVALRVNAWSQFKRNIDRWFYWESTYYNNFQAGMGETNVFKNAATFGATSSVDPVVGETGWNHSNGDGVLFYPGTDVKYPEESYGILGPFASLRLKHWRRGIQDVDYLTLARAKDPSCVAAIVDHVIPKVLWEYGVDNTSDPTYKWTDISWSVNPDVWEAARLALAKIIESGPLDPCPYLP